MVKIGIINENLYKQTVKECSDLIEANRLTVVRLDPKMLNDKNTVKDLDGLLNWKITAEQFELMENLKAVFVPMTGLDHLDESVKKSDRITIYNAHSTADYIAERGFTIMMALLGNLINHHQALKEGIWLRAGAEGRWTTLKNKKIGIYGYGHIGKAFEKMVRPFTDNIYIINRNKEYNDKLILTKDLNGLSEKVDILFISVPMTSSTIGSVDEGILNNMKSGFVINVGRGKIVNEEALITALNKKSIAGYASDVWFNYPNKENPKVKPISADVTSYDNLVMSPHNAWNTDHKEGLIDQEMIEYIRSFLEEN